MGDNTTPSPSLRPSLGLVSSVFQGQYILRCVMTLSYLNQSKDEKNVERQHTSESHWVAKKPIRHIAQLSKQPQASPYRSVSQVPFRALQLLRVKVQSDESHLLVLMYCITNFERKFRQAWSHELVKFWHQFQHIPFDMKTVKSVCHLIAFVIQGMTYLKRQNGH